jgi:SAM-dependent methyltransferase
VYVGAVARRAVGNVSSGPMPTTVMATTLAELLAGVRAERVLDVATGSGGFITELLAALPAPGEIVGVDLADRAAAFGEAFADHPMVRFAQMDAHALEFPDASFDLVAVANSLHHFVDPVPVLGEMCRVLRPGGHLVVAEMVRDRQAAPRMTHVELHHWWGAVDTVRGIVHRPTYPRAGLVAMLSGLDLAELRLADVEDDDDPHDPDTLAELDEVIDRYTAWAAGHVRLQARGDALRQRLHEVGIQGATTLVAVGCKPGGPPPAG